MGVTQPGKPNLQNNRKTYCEGGYINENKGIGQYIHNRYLDRRETTSTDAPKDTKLKTN